MEVSKLAVLESLTLDDSLRGYQGVSINAVQSLAGAFTGQTLLLLHSCCRADAAAAAACSFALCISGAAAGKRFVFLFHSFALSVVAVVCCAALLRAAIGHALQSDTLHMKYVEQQVDKRVTNAPHIPLLFFLSYAVVFVARWLALALALALAPLLADRCCCCGVS